MWNVFFTENSNICYDHDKGEQIHNLIIDK